MKRTVHKFGGTSMAGAERIAHVRDLMRAASAGGEVAVVVSAMAGVTNALFALCAKAASGDASWSADLAALVARHHDVASALLKDSDACAAARARIDEGAAVVHDLLRARAVLGGVSEVSALDEVVAGHGEVWSATLLSLALAVPMLDARRFLVVDLQDTGPVMREAESRALLAPLLPATFPVVITGYVARTPAGAPTTLRRNGSDYSASLCGALLDAHEVVIWTDVDGVLSADPRRVPEAVLVPRLSAKEASELAYFGAKVVHPQTMQPAIQKGIPVWIKNTFHPERPGSVIDPAPPTTASSLSSPVRGFSTVDNVALVNVEGSGMVGVPGVAERLFGALRRAGVNVMAISQASSEHSICVAVVSRDAARAGACVREAFDGELLRGAIQDVTVEDGCAIVAAVGDAMAHHKGVAARFFRALADAGVNVRAIAQGSSERNLSAVVDAADSTRALRAVHAAFLLSHTTLSVGVIGTGGIGASLLAQLAAQRQTLVDTYGVDLRVRAVASSTRMRLAAEEAGALDVSGDVAALLGAGAGPADLDAFAAHVRPSHLPHAVIVDCTASDAVADRYAGWLAAGIHVVTPNKKAGSGPRARVQAIAAAQQASRARLYSEATVGAGLPIIHTLKELVRTGDRVIAVSGVLSGTLSWIFNTLDEQTALSTLVREAKRKGYTEPDPREDLSGLDFARKLVVLARELGKDVELSDVQVEDLAPGLAFGLPVEELLAGLAPVDAAVVARARAAKGEGKVLRFVGTIPEAGAPSVRLEAVPLTHPFARLTGTDNVVAVRTARYDAQPLVVQGPGAGPEVTAGGVFGDLLRLAAHLGGRV